MKRDNQLSNIQRFAAAVDSGKYRTEKEITSAIKCAAGIGTAFKNLGLIYRTNNGRIARKWVLGELPVANIQNEYYRLRKETIERAKQKAPILPDNLQINEDDFIRTFSDAAKTAGISPKILQNVAFEFCEKEPVSLADAIACILAAGGTVVFGDKTNKP